MSETGGGSKRGRGARVKVVQSRYASVRKARPRGEDAGKKREKEEKKEEEFASFAKKKKNSDGAGDAPPSTGRRRRRVREVSSRFLSATPSSSHRRSRSVAATPVAAAAAPARTPGTAHRRSRSVAADPKTPAMVTPRRRLIPPPSAADARAPSSRRALRPSAQRRKRPQGSSSTATAAAAAAAAAGPSRAEAEDEFYRHRAVMLQWSLAAARARAAHEAQRRRAEASVHDVWRQVRQRADAARAAEGAAADAEHGRRLAELAALQHRTLGPMLPGLARLAERHASLVAAVRAVMHHMPVEEGLRVAASEALAEVEESSRLVAGAREALAQHADRLERVARDARALLGTARDEADELARCRELLEAVAAAENMERSLRVHLAHLAAAAPLPLPPAATPVPRRAAVVRFAESPGSEI